MLCVLAKKKVITKYNDLITQVFGENPETSLSGWEELRPMKDVQRKRLQTKIRELGRGRECPPNIHDGTFLRKELIVNKHLIAFHYFSKKLHQRYLTVF